jgi:arylformamidase
MKIYDISMTIAPGMTVYKNNIDNQPSHNVKRDYSTSNAYESALTIHLHTGTHMDAPLHMINGGDTIDQTDLTKVVTWCKVLDLTALTDCITQADLSPHSIEPGDFVLFKTKNSYSEQFNDSFIYLEKSGAQYLAAKGICGVGIDSLGIERSQPNHETHIALLGSSIPILEGLRLAHIKAGRYFLLAVPLNIAGAEAAPVRALLLENDPTLCE